MVSIPFGLGNFFSFFSGPATKALPTPPSSLGATLFWGNYFSRAPKKLIFLKGEDLSGHKNFFFDNNKKCPTNFWTKRAIFRRNPNKKP